MRYVQVPAGAQGTDFVHPFAAKQGWESDEQREILPQIPAGYFDFNASHCCLVFIHIFVYV